MYTDPQSPAAATGAGCAPAAAGVLSGGVAAGRGSTGGMWTYTYKHGDRPLEGYTIERAAGRGGFGEVYYATSDAGREVALKSITGFEQIELRGIGQCMNLKSPHLVSIFDIRQNAAGRWFVIMEYVNGPNLRELLDQSPAGLGPQKAAFFLREIAKGLSYLHDCGIVHRDLKPANIFFENGYVKIGDYGLSKAIEPTHPSGQTVTVGTVHYMAPEVGMGKYDRSIDIYALGALLYEMCTGIVPFVGASAGEILIKHLSHEADCSGIPEPFCSAVKRAMAKDPAQRFATVQEMVEAVFGAEHVRNSVSQFSPTDLSMVAGRIAERIASPAAIGARPSDAPAGAGAATATGSSVTNPNGLGTAPRGEGMFDGTLRGVFGRRWSATPTADAAHPIPPHLSPPPPPPPLAASKDSLKLPQRITLAVVATLVVATGCVAFDQPRYESDIWMHVVLSVFGGSVGILFAARRWLPPPADPQGTWGDRLALGAVGSAMALVTAAPMWMNSWEARQGIGAHVAVAALALAVANPRRLADVVRTHRISFRQVALAGFLAFIGAGIAATTNEGHYLDANGNVQRAGGMVVVSIAVIGGIALVTQVLASWNERHARSSTGAATATADGTFTPIAGGKFEAATAHAPAVTAARHAAVPPPVSAPGTAAASAAYPRTATTTFGVFPAGGPGRQAPRWLVILWFCGTVLFVLLGLSLNVFVANARGFSKDDLAGFIAGTMVSYALGVFCFVRMWQRTIRSWMSYLVMPGVRLLFVMAFLVCWALYNFARITTSDRDGFVIAMMLLALVWSLTWLVPWLWRAAIPPADSTAPVPVAGFPQGASAAANGHWQEQQQGPQGQWQQQGSIASPSTAFAVGAAMGELRNAIRSPITPDTPNSRAERARRRARLRRIRLSGRDRDLDRVLRAATRLERRRRGLSGFVGILGGLLLILGCVLAFGFAIDAPAMVAAGFPDPQFTVAIARDVFGGQVPDWPVVARPLLAVAAGCLMLLGLVATMIGRRQSGAWHMIRALAAVVVFVAALGLINDAFLGNPWQEVAALPVSVNQRNAWLVMRIVVEHLRPVGCVVALVLMALSGLLVALPPRRHPARHGAPAHDPAAGGTVSSSSATAPAPVATSAASSAGGSVQ